MRKILKKYFIPHKENDHKPHILRDASITFFFALVLVVEIGFLSEALLILPHTSGLADVLATVVVAETNDNRTSDNLSSLTENQLLQNAAEAKANDMATNGYFAHNSPEGKTPWYWLQQAGYSYDYAGENLAINFYDSKDVVDAWMNSPEHRANILNKQYSEIGIATAEGTYQGQHALFTVQFFGHPIPNTTSKKLVEVVPETTNTSIALAPKLAPIKKAIPTNTQTSVKGAEIAPAKTQPQEVSQPSAPAPEIKPTLSETIVASPRNVANDIYITILSLLLIALGVSIVIKIKIQHPRVIATGVLFLSVIATFMVLNSQIIHVFGSIQ